MYVRLLHVKTQFLCLFAMVSAAQVNLPGCFVDSAAKRQLGHQICLLEGGCAYLSREWCAQQCKVEGFPIAGVEASHQCSCGHALSDPSKVADVQECNEPCTGPFNETCGGQYRLWAFNVSSVGPPPPEPDEPLTDTRHIPNGRTIHIGGYTCQPYCSVLPDGTWSCVMTYIAQSPYEGSPGEHMVAMQSKDQGRSWSDLVTIEPYSSATTKQVSAYGSVTARPDGSRVFAVWVQNTRDVQNLPGHTPSPHFRADMLGQFVWKYSDDQGRTWSPEHYVIPVPERFIDRHNSWNGTVQIMWQVDHIKQHRGSVIFAFTRIGTYAVAPPEEIYFIRSPNLLTEEDPTKVTWNVWPNADHGVQAVGGTTAAATGIAEEPHIIPMDSIDAFSVVFRTSQGYLGSARSKIGHPELPWASSSYAQYLPVGEKDKDWLSFFPNASAVKNTRGPISPKRQPNGLLLMTYYNNNGWTSLGATTPVADRNNMWLTAGHEENGKIFWTQPELVLYDRHREHWHGYPDIINDGNKIFITEAYKGPPKSEARSHPVSSELIDMLHSQRTVCSIAAGFALKFQGGQDLSIHAGVLPNFFKYPRARYGFTLDVWLDSASLSKSSSKSVDGVWSPFFISSSVGQLGKGSTVELMAASNGTVRVVLQDKQGMTARWYTDPVCSARLGSLGSHYLALVVDAGPKMILWLVDGHLCDGGPRGSAWHHSSPVREGFKAGWSLFNPYLADIGIDGSIAQVGAAVKVGRLYPRALYVSECIGNWRAGLARENLEAIVV